MNNILSFIGLCMKAGLLVSGEFMVEQSLKENSGKLVIIAKDASENTKKKFRNMCEHRNIEYIEFSNKAILGKALGKEVRASICILDVHFAEKILEKIVEKNIDLSDQMEVISCQRYEYTKWQNKST